MLLLDCTNCTGFIRLGKERTKNKTPRVIPLHQMFADLQQNVPRQSMVVMFLNIIEDIIASQTQQRCQILVVVKYIDKYFLNYIKYKLIKIIKKLTVTFFPLYGSYPRG